MLANACDFLVVGQNFDCPIFVVSLDHTIVWVLSYFGPVRIHIVLESFINMVKNLNFYLRCGPVDTGLF